MSVRDGVPETAAEDAHRSPLHVSNDDLDDELVGSQLQVLQALSDLIADVVRFGHRVDVLELQPLQARGEAVGDDGLHEVRLEGVRRRRAQDNARGRRERRRRGARRGHREKEKEVRVVLFRFCSSNQKIS